MSDWTGEYNYYGNFAVSLWEDLGEPQEPTVPYISGWCKKNIGSLNVLIDSVFVTGESGNFSPSFGNAEEAIYSEMFKVKFYEKKIRDAIHGTLTSSGANLFWTELREADSTIRRSSQTEVLKVYSDLKKDTQLNLDNLVRSYKKNVALPGQITADVFNL